MARPTPAFLKALGRGSLPPGIHLGGQEFLQRRILKNDFFAITGLYESGDRRVILKVQRQAPLLGFPMRWTGRILAARERGALRRLAGVPGVPRLIEDWGPTGLVREYIDGRTLAQPEPVNDDYHPRLRALIKTMHAREMAYVDLEKPGNVLVGDDGRPYLIDFQISWYWPLTWGGNLWPARTLRGWLQSGDLYHLIKLQRRTRPDQLAPEVLRRSYEKPWFVRVHGRLTRPLTLLRRRILRKLDPQRIPGERGTIANPEIISGAQG